MTEDSIPREIALSICEEIRIENENRKLKMFTGPEKREFKLLKAKECEGYFDALRPVLGDRLVVS